MQEILTPRDREDWLGLREGYMGSSDAAALLGASPYQSAYSLYCRLTGSYLPELMSERMEWGIRLEPVILDKWMEEHEVTGTRGLLFRESDTLRCASPDLLCDHAVVEAKCVDGVFRREWQAGVPEHIQLQVQWQMMLCRKPCAYVAVLFGGNAYQEYLLMANQDTQLKLYDAAEDMHRRILEGDPPDADASEASMLALRSTYERSTSGEVELPLAIARDVYELDEWREQAKAFSTKVETLKAKIMQALGECDVATIEGEVVATWKGKERRTFRWVK